MIIKEKISGDKIMFIGDTESIYAIYKSIIRASERCRTRLHSIYIDRARVDRFKKVYAIIIDEYTGEINFIDGDCALAIMIDEMEGYKHE